MVGKELIYDDSLGSLEKLYIRLFGAPISGLRVRYRRLMPKINEIMRGIGERENRDSPTEVVDIGCGTGLFTYEIAKQNPNARVLGIDNWTELVEKTAAITRKAGIANCFFEIGDVLNLDFNEKFHCAICIDNLEHIEDDLKVIENIYGSLKRKGIALFHVPGLYRRWLFFAKRTNFDVKGHVRPGYTLEDIRAKIEKAGFSVLEAHYTYGWLETVTNNISYLITGADRRNKYVYAVAFPILNALAFWGQWARPKWGAGVVIVAQKGQLTSETDEHKEAGVK